MSAQLQRLRAEIASDRSALAMRFDELAATSLEADGVSLGDAARAAVALHHAYCAAESIMLRLARAFEGEPAQGPDWHQALLSTMSLEIEGVRPRAFSPSSYASLRMLLAFRHFFRHGYAVSLDPKQLKALADRALSSRDELMRDLDALDVFLAGLAGSAT